LTIHLLSNPDRDSKLTPEEPLLDNPGFPYGIIERVMQELLEAETTQHVGALPPTSEARLALATAMVTNQGLCSLLEEGCASSPAGGGLGLLEETT
jgi:hypothetical protein